MSSALAAAFVCATAASAVEHDAIAPYLTDDVSSVAYVNLEKVDVSAGVEELAKLAIIPEDQLAEIRQTAAAMQSVYSQLLKAGAQRAYLLVRASDFFQGPTLVVEVADERQAQAVADLLRQWLTGVAGDVAAYLPKELAVEGKFVIGASSAERLEEIRAQRADKPREDAIDAVASIVAADAAIVAFGDKDSRRVVREIFPQMPAPFMEIDGELLADGLDSVSVTLTFPPNPTVTLSLKANGNEIAEVFEQSFGKARELLKVLLAAEAISGVPAHQKRAAALMPMLPQIRLDRAETRLSLTFGDDEEELAFLRNVLPALTQDMRASAYRSQRMNNFKQLTLAMLNYESAKGTFPLSASYDESNRPLLSWRVHILPYLEQMELYKQFKLDEPWDSEHNRKLIEKMPAAFTDPDPAVRSAIGEKGRTTYVVPTGEGLIFGGKEPMKFRDVKDGTSNTILIVEVPPSKAVTWTKPEDWEVDLQDPLSGLVRDDREWFTAGYCDGHASIRSTKNEPSVIRALLTPNGKEVVDHNAVK